MYEILIRVETLFLESPPAVLLACGLGVLILGLLLWLAGSHFSAVILGLLGAVVGSACGLLVSQWLSVPPWVSMAGGAVVLTLAAVLFRNALMILLAILVFALAGSTAYSTLVLKETPAKSFSLLSSSLIQPFSQMESSFRQAYITQMAENQDGFVERLRLLLQDAFQTMDPYKWKILLFALAGGVAGLLLIWILKKLVMALCYSGVGALMILIGLEILLLGVSVHLLSWFQNRQSSLSITYLVLVGVGTIYQLLTAKPSNKIADKRGRNIHKAD